MRFNLDNLPSDTALLHRLVRDMATAALSREDEIERLQQIIKQLQRAQYGRRSEQLDPDQFALALEDLGADIARIREPQPVITKAETSTPRRKPLPDDLAREDVLIDVDGEACAGCGGAACIPLARASARCSTGRQQPCVCGASAVPNTPAGVAKQSPRRQPPSV